MLKNNSELILKVKWILHQLAGVDPTEFVGPFTEHEIDKLWEENILCQRACSIWGGGRLTTNITNTRAFNIQRYLIAFFRTLYRKHLCLEPHRRKAINIIKKSGFDLNEKDLLIRGDISSNIMTIQS